MKRNDKRHKVDPRFAHVVAGVITVVWASTFTADLLIKDYDPSPMVHFVMLAVAAWIFGVGYRNGGVNGQSNS